ncbi:polysaccharide biosynthesis protein [Chroococcidiopsis sp. TS-821]|uniref:polysaccharide biosynthesis protein n=1 Tax=Chroococcidiopsis sp. TS-821 TaxID=1378066 RepID=UPI000CEF5A2D|nr:polysaccharide biosynthesis protein [Chroococcidiopsis sp. TS-821]PPS45052.1 epimerase [Chroococcidiopsis sp. TS-821]
MLLPAARATSKSNIIQRIQEIVPLGSPEPQDPQVLTILTELTADLIQAYQAEGQLQEDPFTDVWKRTIHLYESAVSSRVQGKVVLVTGGEGCVGSELVKKLVELGARQVVSVDKARCANLYNLTPNKVQKQAIALYAADIRNYPALKYIFETEKPDIVFHLAAQRLPGLAEVQIRETVTTAICGTQHIIQLCEEYGVQQCIFASTGKAARYFTAEVYAASKKLCEWQIAQAAQKGNVTYGMVRFTHMLNNSSVCQQISDKIQQSKIINIHAPHRYITAQNIHEALHLLLNALVLSQPKTLKFLTVRNLGWPTETLEIALYKIIESGKQLPIYFQGLLPGYEEPCFLGQFDWSQPTEINLLINALENSQVEASGDMMIAELACFSSKVLDKHLSIIRTLTDNLSLPEANIKYELKTAIKEVTTSIFAQTSPQTLLKILKWGTNPKQLVSEGISLEHHRDIIELIAQGLYGRLTQKCLLETYKNIIEFETLVKSLETLPSIQQEVTYLKAVSQSNSYDISSMVSIPPSSFAFCS